MKKILIIGAASAIAQETARRFAAEGDALYLADIHGERLATIEQDINARYATEVYSEAFDALELNKHRALLNNAIEKLGGLDVVFIAHGTLARQFEIENNFEAINQEFHVNFISGASLATIAAEYFEKQNNGTLAVISSVAGDRGRRSNYIYGTSKGALTLYLSGLRGRLSNMNVKVITIKPGLVDTPMTAHFKKNPLYSSAAQVGKAIFNAIQTGKEVVYVPGYWKLIMACVKIIPESIFKKLKF
jgi:decaprenylphospho-beta-D-erythro-pentofuranosid-2-ulose 2-reductase